MRARGLLAIGFVFVATGLSPWVALAALPPGFPPDQLATSVVCGTDLNNDGQVSDAEMSLCEPQAPDGFCDIQAEECSQVSAAPDCPPGSTLNPETDRCESPPIEQACPATYQYDATIDRCVAPVDCPDGGNFNPTTDRCEKLLPDNCPPTYTYSPLRAECWKPVNCSGPFDNGAYDPSGDRCEMPNRFDCATGYQYNAVTRKCEALPFCPVGSAYNPARDRCETAAVNECPAPYLYDPGTDLCLLAASCSPPGVLNTATDRCEVTATLSCPSGSVWNASTRRCEAPLACDSPAWYDGYWDACLTSVQSRSCSPGYYYDWQARKCARSAADACSYGQFNPASHRCEVPAVASCPPAFIYDATWKRCVAPVPCPPGSWYHSGLDVCYYGAGCPSGYWWDGTRNQCVASPVCPEGGWFNAGLDQCASSYRSSCPAGMSYYGPSAPYAVPTCRNWPACPSGSWFDGNLDRCTAGASMSCPATYGYVSSLNQCVRSPVCDGSAYDPASDACRLALAAACPGSYTYNAGTGRCTAPISCGAGASYDANWQRCQKGVLPSPPGFWWDTNVDAYLGGASCPSGSWLQDDVCNQWPQWVCPSQYALIPNTSNCVRQPLCGGAGVYNTQRDKCLENLGGVACAEGYAYSVSQETCLANPLCTGGLFNPDADRCEAAPTYRCPDPSYALNAENSRCERSPRCAAGTYNPAYDLCMEAYAGECPPGMSLDPPSGQCVAAPDCANGTLDAANDLCFQGPIADCAAGYTVSGNLCVMTPACPSLGTFNAASNFCTYPPVYHCEPGYVYDVSLRMCTAPASCGAPTGTLDPANDQCRSPQVYQCPDGWTYVNGRCTYGPPTCPQGSFYDYAYDRCVHSQSPCDAGFLYDRALDVCFKAYQCPSGGTVDGASSQCVLAVGAQCPAGFVLNAGSGYCERAPVCPSGGTLDAADDRCEAAATGNCVAGTSYDGTLRLCTAAPRCSAGSVLDPTVNQCVSTTILDCAPGYAYPGSGSYCTAPPTCPGTGTYGSAAKQCLGPTSLCGAGFTWNPSYGWCQQTPVCPDGAARYPSLAQCVLALRSDCGTGYAYDPGSGLCNGAVPCAAGTAFDGVSDRCLGDPSVTCLPGYAWDSGPDACEKTPACPAGTSFNPASDLCAGAVGYLCPLGFASDPQTGMCLADPGCPAPGSYNRSTNVCDSGPTRRCNQIGFTVDPGARVCYRPVDCGTGVLDGSQELCLAEPAIDCGGWAWDPVARFCVKEPVCAPGAYDLATGECRAMVVTDCGAVYAWEPADGVCVTPVECPQDPNFLLNGSIRFSGVLDTCLSDAGTACPDGLGWTGPPESVCSTPAACTGSYIYDPILDTCVGDGTCPWGPEYPCVPNPRLPPDVLRCARGDYNQATKKCEGWAVTVSGAVQKAGVYDFTASNPGSPPKARVTSTHYLPPEGIYGDGSYLEFHHDGTQLIVSGHMWEANRWDAQVTPSRDGILWLAGSQVVGMTSLIADERTGTVVVTGSAAQPGVLDVRGSGDRLEFWEAGALVGSLSFSMARFSEDPALLPPLYCSPNPCVDMRTAGSTDVQADLTDLTNDGWDPATNQCLGQFYIFNGDAKECLKAGWSTSGFNCCDEDPGGWWIFDANCPSQSKEVVMAETAGLTHYVGTYCKKKIRFIGCMQRAKVYCAFGTKLGRIIHEQGRPQLTAFQPAGKWGDAESPNCVGFKPEEFQALDFGQIDLSEYVEDVQQQANDQVEQRMQDAIQRSLGQ